MLKLLKISTIVSENSACLLVRVVPALPPFSLLYFYLIHEKVQSCSTLKVGLISLRYGIRLLLKAAQRVMVRGNKWQGALFNAKTKIVVKEHMSRTI